MTAEQLDYLYSSQWPEQGWFPSTAEAMLSPEAEQAIEEACVRAQ